MALRITKFLLAGELDNTASGQVKGWITLLGVKGKVVIDLKGNFHRDIRGAKIKISNEPWADERFARDYLRYFGKHQTGKAGDITAGLPPHDFTPFPHIEWYSQENGRVVIELEPRQVKVVGRPIPACESEPISREEQDKNMAEYLRGVAKNMGIPMTRVICVRMPPEEAETEK
jgi:hypothetical protein